MQCTHWIIFIFQKPIYNSSNFGCTNDLLMLNVSSSLVHHQTRQNIVTRMFPQHLCSVDNMQYHKENIGEYLIIGSLCEVAGIKVKDQSCEPEIRNKNANIILFKYSNIARIANAAQCQTLLPGHYETADLPPVPLSEGDLLISIHHLLSQIDRQC